MDINTTPAEIRDLVYSEFCTELFRTQNYTKIKRVCVGQAVYTKTIKQLVALCKAIVHQHHQHGNTQAAYSVHRVLFTAPINRNNSGAGRRQWSINPSLQLCVPIHLNYGILAGQMGCIVNKEGLMKQDAFLQRVVIDVVNKRIEQFFSYL